MSLAPGQILYLDDDGRVVPRPVRDGDDPVGVLIADNGDGTVRARLVDSGELALDIEHGHRDGIDAMREAIENRGVAPDPDPDRG